MIKTGRINKMNMPEIYNIIKSKNINSINKLLLSREFLSQDSKIIINAINALRQEGLINEANNIINILKTREDKNIYILLLHLEGDILLDQKKYDEAIKIYDIIISKNGSDVAFNNRGYAKWCLMKYEEALYDYKKAITLNNNNKTSYRGAGEMCIQLNKPEDAIKLFKKAVYIDPNYVDAIVGEALALYCTRKYRDAYEKLLLAKKIDPNNSLVKQSIKTMELECGIES
jgi:tetratricopeptide (TPR) repeat protein